jgi:hypothetical protein
MPRVGRFLTDQQGGLHCQIVLDSGQKVFVYHDKGGTIGGSRGGLLTIELSRFMGFASDRIFACNLDSPAGQAILAMMTQGTELGSLANTPLGAAIAFVTTAATVAELRTKCAALMLSR